MKRITQSEFDEIVELHRMMLYGEEGGVRADFSDSDLNGADLTEVDLSGADFSGADLHSTDFTDANVDGAIFSHKQLS